jgi:hypothetical protein
MAIAANSMNAKAKILKTTCDWLKKVLCSWIRRMVVPQGVDPGCID